MLVLFSCINQTENLTFKPPHIRKNGNSFQLMVKEKPFIVLAGEVNNSSASDMDYMEEVWDKLVALNCNTAIVPVYWELFEPVEKQFDYSLVEGIINDARIHDLKLVILWFGSWKNSWSTYTPAWVKKDLNRFPRGQLGTGIKIPEFCPFFLKNPKKPMQELSLN
ncbi:MAG: hypothetical protein HC906_13755 [Bacteroidales bacterium]|nr:hypothetical protein [Bacteroidales bacterium]